VDDRPTTLWTLRRDADEIACQVRLAAHGIEVDLLRGGTVVLTRVFATDEEALGWARDKQQLRESQGWRLVPPAAADSDQRPVA